MKVVVPAKLILFGEWGVLRGGTAFGVPLVPQFEMEARIGDFGESTLTSRNEDFSHVTNLFFDDAWAKAAWAVIAKALPLGDAHLQAVTNRGWKLHEGLGSSSALFLSLLEIMETHHNTTLPWARVLEIFREVVQNRGSGMDLAIQRTRAPTVYRDFVPTRLGEFHWPRELVLLHGTRKARSAREIEKIQPGDSDRDRLNQSTEVFLRSERAPRDWVRAMNEHREVLSDLGVTPPEGDLLYQEFSQRGTIESFKSVGAGGMDGLLVWARDPDRLRALAAPIAEMGWYFSPHGVSP